MPQGIRERVRLDSAVPGAGLLLHAAALRRWLADRGIEVRASRMISCAILKYRAGRRLAARIRVGRDVYYVKAYRPERARRVQLDYRGLEATLATVSGLVLPEVVAQDADLGLIAWRGFPGRPLLDGKTKPSQERVSRRLSRAGFLLARVHATRAPLTHRWTAEDELRVLRERTSEGPPAAPSLFRELESLLPKTASPATVHRDFYPQQVLAEARRGSRSPRLAFVDWDDASLGPPGLDVGNALAHLELEGIRDPRLASKVPEWKRSFTRGYRRGNRRPSGNGTWTAWMAASLLRLSGIAWERTRKADPVWRALELRGRSRISDEQEASLLVARAAEQLQSRHA